MIINTFSESEILKELLVDYKEIKRFAKKNADKYLCDSKRKGRFIREDDYQALYKKSNLRNQWLCINTYNQTKKIPWYSKACCIVEGEKKTKDYYIVRGVNTEKPYFVKLTSHALKRVKERVMNSKTDLLPEMLALLCFQHRETVVGAPYANSQHLDILNKLNIFETSDDMSHIFLTWYGFYYGYITDNGNYIFKTYISNIMGLESMKSSLSSQNTKWNLEGNLLLCLVDIHQYFNRNLYDKEDLDKFLYRDFGPDPEIDFGDNNRLAILKP